MENMFLFIQTESGRNFGLRNETIKVLQVLIYCILHVQVKMTTVVGLQSNQSKRMWKCKANIKNKQIDIFL